MNKKNKIKVFIEVLYADLSRAFHWKTILICVVGCFFCLLLNNEEDIFDDWQGVTYYFENSLNWNYACMMYIFAAIPYAGSYLVDVKNHYIHIFRIRSGNQFYLISKVVSAFLSGFAVMTLGCIVYILFLSINLPMYTGEFNDQTYQILLKDGNVLGYFIVVIFMQALAGGILSSIAFCVSTFVSNTYSVWCFPFLFYYAWMRLDRVFKFPDYLSIGSIIIFPVNGNVRKSVIYATFFLGLLLAGFVCVCFPRMKRRMLNE